MITNSLTHIITEMIKRKTEEEIKKGREKKIVAVPSFLRIFWYIITPFVFCISFMGFVFLFEFLPLLSLLAKLLIIVFSVMLPIICIVYVLLSGTKVVYNDSEIEVVLLWARKRRYNIIDIKKARSSLYFYVVTFSDSFVLLTESMTASSEFYSFAVKHASSVKGKY